MKSESQIIDEVYENQVYRICTVYVDAMITGESSRIGEPTPSNRFKAGMRVARTLRDRAKALLKEVDDG